MKDINRIALVDIAHYFRPAFEASIGEPERAGYEATLNAVYSIEESRLYDEVVCVVDWGPYKRALSYPDYKANRPPPDPVMGPLYERTQDKLEQEGFLIWKAQGYEADDIIATAVRHANRLGICVDIYCSDKDLFQLVSKTVHVVWTRDGTRYDPGAVTAKLVPPKQVIEYLALVGDKSDNIPGCPGIGHKTAQTLLASYPTAADVLEAAGRGALSVNKKQLAALKESADSVNLSHALVALMDDAPIVWADIYQEERIKEQPPMNQESIIIEEEQPEEQERRGNSLIGGALARKEGPGIAQAKMRDEDPRQEGHVEMVDGIELRPGVSMTGGKYALMTKMAVDFHNSQLYRKKFANAQAIFAVMELGLELGISPQVACQQFHMIEGKPTPAAHFLIARAQQDPSCEFFECVEETPTSVTYACKKRNYSKELRFTYSLKDAEDDGQRWARSKKNQRAMLRKTAGSQAARLWFPGACSGLYSMEEMGYEPDIAAA